MIHRSILFFFWYFPSIFDHSDTKRTERSLLAIDCRSISRSHFRLDSSRRRSPVSPAVRRRPVEPKAAAESARLRSPDASFGGRVLYF